MAGRFERGEKLGEGTWGVVTLGVEKTTGRKVALKKIGMGAYRDGVNFTALREVRLLQEIKHPNIIELVDVFTGHDHITLVFDYCATDMEHIIEDKSLVLSPAHVKGHMLQLLSAVEHCHSHWILHRDLKPNNCLYLSDGTLKLADFGLARTFGSPGRLLSPQMCTLWYRPPELLFGSREYGPGVDVWGVGCVFAELMMRRPLFQQNSPSELQQLQKTFQIMGTPVPSKWKDMGSLPSFVEFVPQPPVDFSTFLTAISAEAMDLLQQMLRLNPSDRICASQALSHDYFKTRPEASPPGDLPLPVAAPAPTASLSAPPPQQQQPGGDDVQGKHQQQQQGGTTAAKPSVKSPAY